MPQVKDSDSHSDGGRPALSRMHESKTARTCARAWADGPLRRRRPGRAGPRPLAAGPRRGLRRRQQRATPRAGGGSDGRPAGRGRRDNADVIITRTARRRHTARACRAGPRPLEATRAGRGQRPVPSRQSLGRPVTCLGRPSPGPCSLRPAATPPASRGGGRRAPAVVCPAPEPEAPTDHSRRVAD